MAAAEGAVIACHTNDEFDALFLAVNIEELEETAKKYKIHSIPTFYFIRNGETLESFASANPNKLEDAIKKYYVAGTPAALASA